MTPDQIRACFTQPDGRFLFARFADPVATLALGLGGERERALAAALKAAAADWGLPVASEDGSDAGASLMIVGVETWDDLLELPGLVDAGALGSTAALVRDLTERDRVALRRFGRDDEGDGRLQQVVSFQRLGSHVGQKPADRFAEVELFLCALRWSAGVWANPVTDAGGHLLPHLVALVRAAYRPEMPNSSTDPSLADRLAAAMADEVRR